MTLARYIQSPDEIKNYLIDYSTWLGTGETIVSAVATVPLVTAPPLAATAIAASTSVALTISGGVVDEEYTIKITALTTAGQVKEDCININVETACG